jgi:hypothetical protein
MAAVVVTALDPWALMQVRSPTASAASTPAARRSGTLASIASRTRWRRRSTG